MKTQVLLILLTLTPLTLGQICTCEDNVSQCCCDNLEPDGNTASCSSLISDSSKTVHVDEVFTIRGDPKFQDDSNLRCTWITPDGDECEFLKTNNVGDACAADGAVTLATNPNQGSCDIEVEADLRHDGTWELTALVTVGFYDTIDIKVKGKQQYNPKILHLLILYPFQTV